MNNRAGIKANKKAFEREYMVGTGCGLEWDEATLGGIKTVFMSQITVQSLYRDRFYRLLDDFTVRSFH